MTVKVTLPQLGETVAEGTILRWLKAEGDPIEKDELLFEISTDKVDSEVPAPASGTLAKILVPEGETVNVGTPIAEIAETGEEVGVAAEPQPEPAAAAAGGAQRVAEVRPSETPSPGVQSAAPQPVQAPAVQARPGATGPMSPVVSKLVAEHGLDITRIPGTGTGGRVTKKDVMSFIEQGGAAAEAAPAAQPAAAEAGAAPGPAAAPEAEARPAAPRPQAPPAAAGEGDQIVEISAHRRMIAQHMLNSRRSTAHVTAVVEVDMSNVSDTRKRYKEEFQRREGFSLTYFPFIALATIDALLHFPKVNASMVDEKHLVMHKNVNLGVAVAIEETDDLIVPVIKKADELNIVGIARAVRDLAIRTREGKLSPDEVKGGTFTITNPGVFGSVLGAPVINYPEAAILSLEAIQERVVVVDHSIGVRPMVYLPLSYDHRILDGMIAAKFLQRLKHNLEEWDFAAELG